MHDATRHITLNSIPSMPSMLLRAATARKHASSVPQFRPLRVSAKNIRIDPARLKKFNAVCGFTDSDIVPLPYPHIMAFALHMQLMLEPEFPFTPMGAVHVRNRIHQQRAIRADEILDFEVRLGATEQVEKGHEISIITEVRIAGELVWDDLSVMLIRKGGSAVKKEKNVDAAAIEYEASVQWQLAANKGRQYAAASGDYNPIHLYALTAKPMGFKRQIMHGMWSKSRCVAQLLPADHDGSVTVEVAFKLPIFLPATVTLFYQRRDASTATGIHFELKDATGEKPHLAGKLTLDTAGGASV